MFLWGERERESEMDEREREPFSSPPQEERAHNTTMKSELNVLEGVLEKSGDQTKEELRTLKQMFEQSEQSRNTCEFCLQWHPYSSMLCICCTLYMYMYVILHIFSTFYMLTSSITAHVQCIYPCISQYIVV